MEERTWLEFKAIIGTEKIKLNVNGGMKLKLKKEQLDNSWWIVLC